MHKQKFWRRALASLTLVFFAQAAMAEQFVWRASSNSGPKVYLSGSVHLLPPRAYPLPEPFERAYNQSEIVVFETDMGELQSPQTQMQLLALGAYPPGTSLQDELPAALLQRLQKVATEVNLPMAAMQRFRPWFIGTLIELSAFTKAGFQPDLGIDFHFYERAIEEEKAVLALEPVAEHLQVLAGMSPAQSQAYLRDTLNNIDALADAPGELYDYWRAGDIAGLEAYVEEQQQSDPTLYKRLVDDRNRDWIADIEALLKGNANAMVIVGALHLVGEAGLPALLTELGYTVERL